MSSETIISIIVTIAVSLIPYFVRLIDEKRYGTKVFIERESAERRMINDMARSKELNFVGITHDKMTEYLGGALAAEKELHWETINFYFPTPEYGLCWDRNFNNKMSLNILKISNYLMNNNIERLGTLKEVNFYLNQCGFNIGGSFFKFKNSGSYNVIYDVMQIISTDKKQEHAKTIRLNHRFHKQFFKRLEEMFEEIKRGSQLLYSINAGKKDLWNQSAYSWDNYERDNTSPHSQSMHHMLNELYITNDLNILSLGAGTGKMEKLLKSGFNFSGFLGLVDKSYTMLYKAYERMKKDKNVSYALIDLADREWQLYGALAGRKYDYILIHFSLHNFISNEQSLGDFAGRLKEILAYNGKIVVAIHDHVYDLFDENEMLRNKIKSFADDKKIGRHGKNKFVSLNDLKSGFFDNGLKVIRETEQVIARNIRERVTMWKVEAILDTVVDVDELNGRKLKDALFKELDAMRSGYSKPMAVRYITFSDVIQVASALIMNAQGEFLTVIKNGAHLLPGGEMRFGESEEDALLRELGEELRIDPGNLIIESRLGGFVFEKAFLEAKPLHMNVFRCTLNQTTLTPDNEITDYAWINLKKFTTYENMPREYFLQILDAADILLR